MISKTFSNLSQNKKGLIIINPFSSSKTQKNGIVCDKKTPLA
jgi:hypothetical protein